jgi:NAD(P)-dependent dehydrogenase (short-subunit alcohol dehydrogenase family)
MAFGAESTAEEVVRGVDLSGKTAIVTGANCGIGLETARVLAAAGARVIVTARDAAKVETTLAELRQAVPDAEIEGVAMELGSLASVRAAADRLAALAPRIDFLINNAGIMFAPFARTEDGFESQFGVNHLGHFVLTGRLAPNLAPGARVIDVSSSAHMFSDVLWDDPNWTRRPYDKFIAYSQSKTANILHALELDRRLAGRGVRAFSLHPGGIRTNLMRHMQDEDRADVGEAYGAVVGGEPRTYGMPMKSIPQGAATTVWAAVSPELAGKGGLFLSDCQVAPPGSGREIGAMPYALDPERARRLWALSEALVDERFPLA